MARFLVVIEFEGQKTSEVRADERERRAFENSMRRAYPDVGQWLHVRHFEKLEDDDPRGQDFTRPEFGGAQDGHRRER